MLVQGDAAKIPLPDKSVHCCVTSPPYWGLRKYAGDQSAGMFPDLGLEKTPQEHIDRIVAIMAEVHRVLRDDGVVWLNYGDCYASGTGRSYPRDYQDGGAIGTAVENTKPRYDLKEIDIPAGNLMLIPHRIAIALQDDRMKHKATIPGGEIGAAWLAGVIDCDGSMGIRKQTRKDKDWNPSYSLYMAVKLTDQPIVDECVNVTGIGKVRFSPRRSDDYPGIKARKDRYVWRLDGAVVAEVLPSIYPYLQAKRKQALILYNLDLLNKIIRGQKVQSSELLEKKDYLYQSAKNLNQRKEIDLPDWIVDIPEYTDKPRWIVRQDLIWYKRNPMPESQAGWRFEREKERIKSRGKSKAGIDKYESMGAGNPHASRDGYEAEYEYGDYHLRKGSWRHTRAHEYVFMLTKKMQYWANQEAVREQQDFQDRYKYNAAKSPRKVEDWRKDGKPQAAFNEILFTGGRNPRSVLDVPTAPYSGAHYATFPPNLIAPLIRATCPRWCCLVCGQGWSPVVEKSTSFEGGSGKAGRTADEINSSGKWAGFQEGNVNVKLGPVLHTNIKSYRPTCDHPHTQNEALPGIVLDPFVGSGTTVMVAKELLRRGIGLDISMEYLDEQAKIRTGISSPSNQFDELPLFVDMEF